MYIYHKPTLYHFLNEKKPQDKHILHITSVTYYCDQENMFSVWTLVFHFIFPVFVMWSLIYSR